MGDRRAVTFLMLVFSACGPACRPPPSVVVDDSGTPTDSAPPDSADTGDWENTATIVVSESRGWTDVSAGGDWTCGLRDGDLLCWGDSDLPIVSEAPQGKFTAVSTGFIGCAIRADDGELQCWGDHALLNHVPSGSFRAISARGNRPAGLREDGTVACWDRNGASEAPTGTFIDVIDGGLYGGTIEPANDVCGLAADGTTVCTPRSLLGLHDQIVTDLAFNLPYGVAVAEGGADVVWIVDASGDDPYYPLAGTSAEPPGVPPYVAVASWQYHSWAKYCLIDGEGALHCVGKPRDFSGVLNGGIMAEPAGRYGSLFVGSDHACAIRDDSALVCWGTNTVAQAIP